MRIAWTLMGALLGLATATAADPAEYLSRGGRHRILPGDAPPGYLGQARLQGRGPVVGYFQPVAITGPPGTKFALAHGGAFVEGEALLQAGLLIGSVYRFRITELPGFAGAELYPTIELIDRTYPPPGLATRFPIRIDLDDEDFQAALGGQLVTRVIFLEDPQTATPMLQDQDTIRPLDILENQDPLEIADRYGRPLAIVRIGSVTPPQAAELLPQFFFGDPPWAPIHQPTASPVPAESPLEEPAAP